MSKNCKATKCPTIEGWFKKLGYIIYKICIKYVSLHIVILSKNNDMGEIFTIK